LVGIGFNQHLAWTHTVSTSSRFTFYQLKLVPGDPTSYYVDGHAEKMSRITVDVDTTHGTKSHTFYATRWGRVLDVTQAGYKWTTTTAYAVDDSTANDGARAANQYLRMGQATTVQQLLSVEGNYLAIPTFNTVAADDTGHVYYGDVGNTPNVPQSLITECLPSGVPQLVFSEAGVVTLDGSRSACAWENDPGTPIPGIFDASHLPHTIRTDYVENSNDSYWLANPSDPFPAYSPIIGDIDTEQGLRTRLGNEMIARRVAGTDGLGPPKFTISTLQKMWESDQSLEAQLVLGSLVDDCRSTPEVKATNGTTVDLGPACAALAEYSTYDDGDLNAKGGWLFSEWAVFAPSSSFWSDAFNPALPLSTPSQLNSSNPAILKALADAVLSLRSHKIELDASYGQVQYAERHGLKIPIPGCDTGCFNAIYASDGLGGPLYDAPYGEVYDGSSLVMTTELTPGGPKSQGIVTYSQATNPRSPWYSNMTELYSKAKWVPLRFTKAELARDHGKMTVTLEAS
jgi:acyl-homoserine-lactone acylase